MTGLLATAFAVAQDSLRGADPALSGEGPVYRMPPWGLGFTGTATGGELVLAVKPTWGWSEVRIKTEPGESAENVAKRLYDEIRRIPSYSPAKQRFSIQIALDERHAKVQGGTITGLSLSRFLFMLGGSETGLGIPPPPHSLTLRYDFKEDVLQTIWETAEAVGAAAVPAADATKMVVQEGRFRGDTPNGIPRYDEAYFAGVDNNRYRAPGEPTSLSAQSMMVLRGQRLEELNIVSFPGGVAPNWMAWGVPQAAATKIEFRDGLVPWRPNGKPPLYYQTMVATGLAADSHYRFGLHRKFFALDPKVRYRLGCRWFCSSPAVAADGARLRLSVAGLEKRGAAFSPAALLTPGATVGKAPRVMFTGAVAKPRTENLEHHVPDEAGEKFIRQLVAVPVFAEFRTGTADCPDLELPPGCDTFFVWVELEGTGVGEVTAGFDKLFLEELPPPATE